MEHQVFKFVLLNDKNEIKETHTYNPLSPENKALESSSHIHSISLFRDDTIENIKYKLCSVLEDKDINQYSFHYKCRGVWKDAKSLFSKLRNRSGFISCLLYTSDAADE